MLLADRNFGMCTSGRIRRFSAYKVENQPHSRLPSKFGPIKISKIEVRGELPSSSGMQCHHQIKFDARITRQLQNADTGSGMFAQLCTHQCKDQR